MKQLLIVKSSTALNGGASAPKDLSSMAAGSIGFFALNDYANWLSAAPTTNFGIALGRPNNSPAFVIPEVDVNTLQVTETANSAGAQYSVSVTIPSAGVETSGKNYTLVLVKLGTGINGERNKWTQSVYVPAGKSMPANDLAEKLRKGFKAMADAGSIDVTVGGTNAVVTITGKNFDEWNLVAGDDLFYSLSSSVYIAGTAIIEPTTKAEPAIGDKAYVQKLASECAAGKGFNNTDLESQHIYPGYPEAVEDTTYRIFNLRFATGRDAGKQTDERVWQYVHIAVPESATTLLSAITTILTQPVLPNVEAEEENP